MTQESFMRQLMRRRAPAWVQQTADRPLHALGMRLQRQFREEGLSGPQSWLFDAVVSELEHRARRRRSSQQDCLCELCCSPFPDLSADDASASRSSGQH